MTRMLSSGLGMVSDRSRDRLILRLRDEGIQNEAVLQTVRDIPRHLFIDEALASRAYEDTALPILCKQTISQPYIVARMTEILLQENKLDKVLEVGTGSGYQAAVLSAFVGKVYSVERHKKLMHAAKPRFRKLNIRNILVRHGDGFGGWAEKQPFDAIILTAAPELVPSALFSQLNDGGILLAPVGNEKTQNLIRYRRKGQQLEREVLEQVMFVPMLEGVED
ncbi:MAG: protein-L-isoaspartate(D-aspartate) O-methyltransferase [bacterium]